MSSLKANPWKTGFIVLSSLLVLGGVFYVGTLVRRESNAGAGPKPLPPAVAATGTPPVLDPGEEEFSQARRYFDGTGVPKDELRAFQLFLAAAQRGHRSSMITVGYMYENGIAVSVDGREAAKWYEHAGKLGDTDGLLKLGAMYCRGQVIPQNTQEGVRIFHLAAQSGNVDAMEELGKLYSAGVGVPQDRWAGVEWLGRASEATASTAGKTRRYFIAMGLVLAIAFAPDGPKNQADNALMLSKAAASLRKLPPQGVDEELVTVALAYADAFNERAEFAAIASDGQKYAEHLARGLAGEQYSTNFIRRSLSADDKLRHLGEQIGQLEARLKSKYRIEF